MAIRSLRGLYAITDATLAARDGVVEQVRQALAGGARVIQYRDKGQDADRRLREASALAALCREQGVPLIINDDVALAVASGAAGVHLGRDDPAIGPARERLGPEAIIGVSCYDRLELALAAAEAGADYIAFGRFFPSSTKPLAVQARPELLREARRRIPLPLVAIGGITPENGRLLIEAGADLLAVIHAVFGQADVVAACRRFAGVFESLATNEARRGQG